MKAGRLVLGPFVCVMQMQPDLLQAPRPNNLWISGPCSTAILSDFQVKRGQKQSLKTTIEAFTLFTYTLISLIWCLPKASKEHVHIM